VTPHDAAWSQRPPLVGPRDLSETRLRSIERGMLVGLALGAVAILVASRPARRVAGRAVRVALTTWLPAMVMREVRNAWRRSAVAPPTHEGV
jgi:hypothetical protein